MYSCHRPGHVRNFVGRLEILRVPVRHHVLAVGIDRKPQQQDHVVENVPDLRRVPVHQVVGELNGVLRAGDLSRVQPSVDMHDHFPGVRQRMRIGFAQPLHQRQPPRRVTIFFKIAQILRGGNDREIPVASFGRLPRLDQLQLIGGSGQFLKVRERLVVIGQKKIVSRLMPQHGFRSRHLRKQRRGNQKRRKQPHKNVRLTSRTAAGDCGRGLYTRDGQRCYHFDIGRVAQVDRASAF